MMIAIKSSAWLDALVLMLLCLYTLSGIALTPFHGDEAMQIYAASDYFTLFVEGEPQRLMTQPPYPVDSDAHLRILNGSVNRYAIGFAWQISGFTRADLPPPPGWQWALSVNDNIAQGYMPRPEHLQSARIPSTTFHCFSILMLYTLACAAGGRRAAIVAAMLYTLHPALLLNGRRALQESAMLCFGLLSLWSAQRILRLEQENRPTHSVLVWLLLALACALTLASKHSGIILVGAAAGWLMCAAFTHARSVLMRAGQLTLSLSAALLLFIAFSPALWNMPAARLADLIQVRGDLIDNQVSVAGGAPDFIARLDFIATQPFLRPAQYYEAPTFDTSSIHEQIQIYEQSGLAGIPLGTAGGILMTLLAALGVIASMLWSPIIPLKASRWGLLIALGVATAALLANPLPWQRYYLPLITLLCLFAALGLKTLMRALSLSRHNQSVASFSGGH